MDKSIFSFKQKSATQQRNLAVLSMVFMGVVVVVLSLVVFLQERTVVIVPSKVSGEYEISNKGTTNITYLEDMGIATVYNFLTVSPETFAFTKHQILKLTASSKRGSIEKLLRQTETILQSRNISTAFRLERIVANPMDSTVKVYGQLVSFMTSKQVLEENKAYKVTFSFKGATLLLEDFREIGYEK